MHPNPAVNCTASGKVGGGMREAARSVAFQQFALMLVPEPAAYDRCQPLAKQVSNSAVTCCRVLLMAGLRATFSADTPLALAITFAIMTAFDGLLDKTKPPEKRFPRRLRGGDEGELNPLSRRAHQRMYYRLIRRFGLNVRDSHRRDYRALALWS
jgi:hypothetical protein